MENRLVGSWTEKRAQKEAVKLGRRTDEGDWDSGSGEEAILDEFLR